MSRFFSIVTFFLIVVIMCLTLAGLVTTNWFVGPGGFHTGIPSKCSDTTVTVHGTPISYCTKFSLDAFANDTERWLAGALAGVFLLAMATAGLLCYSCCAQTHGIIRVSLLVQATVLLAVCGIFALYRRDKLPASPMIGSSFYAVLAASGLAVVTSWVNSCGLPPKDYQRLPS